MNKEEAFERLIGLLDEAIAAAAGASRAAAETATDEESRAKSKWETQGLEASYLAAGQAGQVLEFGKQRARLQSMRTECLAPRTRAEIGAMVSLDFGTGAEDFWILPSGGGMRLEDGPEILSTGSPLAVAVRGKAAGSSVALESGAKVFVATVR